MNNKEQIKNRAKEYAYNNYEQGGDSDTWEDIFSDGAEYGYQLAVNKACEWLKNTLPSAMMRSDLYMFNGGFIENFKKAQKGGEE